MKHQFKVCIESLGSPDEPFGKQDDYTEYEIGEFDPQDEDNIRNAADAACFRAGWTYSDTRTIIQYLILPNVWTTWD